MSAPAPAITRLTVLRSPHATQARRQKHRGASVLKTVHGRRLQLGFGIPIVMLIALSAVSYQRLAASTTGAERLRQSHQVIEGLAAVLADTQDVETGYRGFLLVGDERFLQPYADGLVKAPADLAALTLLTAHNPDQQ